ncbi:hypothetical protein NKG94_33595 [Micromonospora sp. M12]
MLTAQRVADRAVRLARRPRPVVSLPAGAERRYASWTHCLGWPSH